MSSVWKRIQRVGKRASKFQFIASYQTLTLECSRDGKWQPNKLSVVWTRRNRRKGVKPETWQPSISNPFRGMIVWTDPEEVEISVTLYKDAREGSPFEDKLWTFVIEDESITGKRRPVASVSVNMVDYHSVDLQTFCVNLPLRPASKKVVSASLDLNLACVLLKEGNATDEDMISMSSLLSLNDPYGSKEYDFDGGKNFKRNAGKRLSLRSAKSHKNKPTFNLASNTGSPKEPKKNVKSKEKKNGKVNLSFPAANHITANSLNKPISTSDTDLSKLENRSDFEEPKKGEQMSAPEQSLLKWCQECVEGYSNVCVTNMTTSWRNGLAFCAIIHHFNPDMIDFSSLKPDNIRENNRIAFEAFDYLGISRMLDPHQMALSSVPDKLLIMTYLHQIKQYFTTRKTTAEDDGQDDDVTLATIFEAERSLRLNTENLIKDVENNDFTKLKNNELSDAKTDASKGNPSKIEYKANPGYNPFEEDEPIAHDKTDVTHGDCETKAGSTIDLRANNDKPIRNEQDNPAIITSEKLEKDSAKNTIPEIHKIKVERQENGVKQSQHIKQKDDRFQERKTDVEKSQNVSRDKEQIKLVDPWEMNKPDKHSRIDSKESENAFEKHEKLDKNEENSTQERVGHKTNEKGLENVLEKPLRVEVKENKIPMAADDNKTTSKSLQETDVYSPKPGYNPFLDEESELSSKNSEIEKPKSLNPFDEDYVDDVIKNETVQGGGESQSLNPFDDNYEEPFETDLDKVLDESRLTKTAGASDSDSGLGGSLDGRVSANNVDGVTVAKNSQGSPVGNLKRELTRTSNVSDDNIMKGSANDKTENSISVHTKALQKTADACKTSSVVKATENDQVSNMHRKEPRRPDARSEILASKSPTSIKKELTESHIKLKRPESAVEIGRKETTTSPTPARGQLSLPSSPRSRIPSFEEWKAKKSDDAAKQEKLKAQARQMIKEARATSTKSQNTTEQAQNQSVPAKPTSASLPRLQSSGKKHKAPEPPSVPRQNSLASKLKDEIEFQKRITEKTRKTLESSRIKRINPKQENVPEIEQRSGRSEKVQQAIREARERPNTKAVKPQTTADTGTEDATMEASHVTSPPKPPRAYTYNEETGVEDQVEPQETVSEVQIESQETENETKEKTLEAEDNVADNYSVNSSLQQNPFKLTFKKKESVTQAVIKPLPSTIGRDTKIDLKKYSSKLSETLPARIGAPLSSSQESLSDHMQSSEEEDVNDILDNVCDVSESENKTDDELYDNGEDEEGFQDTSQYVEHEIAVLEEDRIALDRVAVKLEKELREAMSTADCKEDEQRLFQEWFLLVNKRNEIVRRQTELSILEKEEDLEKRFELLNRELRFLMSDSNREKTAQEKKREELLLAELVRLVNKRDELVRIEDSQVQEAEKVAQHVEHVVRNTKIPKKQADCCIQ